MVTKKSIGDVRPSQLITTFGPGAIVDLQTVSIIVAGIDEWHPEDTEPIKEPRLQQALGVNKFYAPKPVEGGNFYSKRGTVPAYLFPRYQVCPVCHTLSEVGEGHTKYDAKWCEIKCTAPNCKGKGKVRATTLPSPFIVACEAGHLDDFPFREYVHRGKSCNKRLFLKSSGRTGTITDIYVECSCGDKRPMGDAFGEKRGEVFSECSRRRPWLGPKNRDKGHCNHNDTVRAMQRGATNVWFPMVRSALAIKEVATPIGRAITECDQKQIAKIDSIEKLTTLIEMEMFPLLEEFPAEQVWHSIQKMRGEIETDETDLRWPEWQAFRNPAEASNENADLFLEEGEVPEKYTALIKRIVLARKLLEVRALIGFTRIDSLSSITDSGDVPDIAPIYRNKPDWLPAVEVRGEGIFIELNEEEVASWEGKDAVKRRAKAMADKYSEWEAQRKKPHDNFSSGRFILLHTLAHALIRQLSLDCGYSASSVRERIYCSDDPERLMCGILLYTAAADSEGSLGGLVDLGSPARFPELFEGALISMLRCSSDPLCADHQPDVHATINGAACHACALVSETSCEAFNRFLDRNVIVPTMAHSDIAFFPDPLSS